VVGKFSELNATRHRDENVKLTALSTSDGTRLHYPRNPSAGITVDPSHVPSLDCQ